MAKDFRATISLNGFNAPLTHTKLGGRTVKRGDSFVTTSPEEAAYYRSIQGFSVVINRGKLASKKVSLPVEDDEITERDPSEVEDEDTEDEDEDERDDEVSGVYEEADLKKLGKRELLNIIKTDDELPISLKDVPKKAGKTELIDLILEAQSSDEDDEDGEDEDEDDEDDDE